ncbi:MAG: hypothetical protein KAH18_04945 [Psychromonas sp.]|nr:hypothetical protein [Psychromonas sp.]
MNPHKKLLTILLFTSAFIIAGCGGDKQENKSPTPTVVTPTSANVRSDIQGVWMQNCKTDPSGMFKFTKKYTYTGNKLDYVLTYYSIRAEDKGVCATAEYKIQITSDIVFKEVINKGSQDEQNKIDMTVNKAVVSILSASLLTTIYTATQDALQNTYNGHFGVDTTNWVLNQPRDLTTEYIRDKLFGFGGSLLDIYQVSGDKLSFGDRGGNIDADNRPMTLDTNTNTLSKNLTQWASTATASSEYGYGHPAHDAHQASGVPDSTPKVGDVQIGSSGVWAEANQDWAKLNTLTLTYATPVKISTIIVRETFNPGTISKVEVMKDSIFVTVYSKNGANEIGGSMSGVQPRKVSDAKITLDAPLDYYSNQIRITIGDSALDYNQIDAVKLIGKP